MKKYKWIMILSVMSLFFLDYFYHFYIEYHYCHKIEYMSTNEIQKCIKKVEIEKPVISDVLILYNHFIINHEDKNTYLSICFMKTKLNQSIVYEKRIENYLKYNGLSSLNNCPTNPLELVEDHNSIMDNILAYFFNSFI